MNTRKSPAYVCLRFKKVRNHNFSLSIDTKQVSYPQHLI